MEAIGYEESLNDMIYKQIKSDIMNMVLKPGEGVSVQKLATRYGVSRTPVRECFIRLEREGLLEIRPQRKTLIALIDLKRVQEEWFIRTTLELGVAERFMEGCGKDTIVEMNVLLSRQAKALDVGDYREFFKLDGELHRLIFETAGEGLAWKTIEEVNSHYNRIRYLSFHIGGVDKGILAGHEQMMVAADKKDLDSLKAVFKSHVNHIWEEQRDLVESFPQYFVNTGEEKREGEEEYEDVDEMVWE